MEIKKILVTGSEGYIGSTLVGKLLDAHYEVVGLDAIYFPYESTQKPHYQLIKQDIRDLDELDLHGYDAVIHLAALSNDPIGQLSPNLTRDINYTATINLAKKSKQHGVKKFILSSSCSIYGTAENGVVDEMSKTHPLTEYAHSKIDSESELKKLADDSFYVYLLRNATVYGYAPNYRDDLVVNNLTSTAYVLGSINILSDGTPWRPLIDVRDLSDIFIAFLNTNKDLSGKVINIGFEENNVQVKDVVEIVHKLLPKAKVNYLNERPDDKRSYRVDFSRFKKYFPNITQQWTIEKSVKNLIEAYDNHFLDVTKIKDKEYVRLHALKNLITSNKLDDKLYWITK